MINTSACRTRSTDIEEADDDEDHEDNIEVSGRRSSLLRTFSKQLLNTRDISKRSNTGWMETTSTGRSCPQVHISDNSKKHGLTYT